MQSSALQAQVLQDASTLFQAANPRTLDWLLTTVNAPHEYAPKRAVLMEDSWGNAVYLILAGWVKVRRLVEDDFVTLAVLGPGEVFGEMAVLDEGSPRSTDVVSLSSVKVLSIGAPQFIQALMTDPQMQYRMLQMMVQRLKQTNARFQLRNQPPARRLASTLVDLGEKYGQVAGEGVEIFSVPLKDLADISDITMPEAEKLMLRMQERKLVETVADASVLRMPQFKQLQHFAGRL